MRLERQSNGQRITLDAASPLGFGGEARIYAVLSDTKLAAKIYHKPTEEYARKLGVMLAHPPEDPATAPESLAIAWPIDLLRAPDYRRRVVGYLMPRVSGMRPVFDFYNPLARRQLHPLCSYLYLHRIARNLAAAVRALHARGYVIGDLNESNILVTETALVTLVDTDSFQVRDPQSGELFRCPVGKPEFTPPELQGKTFLELDRAPEHDLFGLAVLLFQLLMEGTHPFAGVYQGAGEPPSYDARILAGHFPHGTRRAPYRPMPAAPPIEILHPTVRQLFIRCFEDGHANPKARPDANTWQNVLGEAEAALMICSANEQHRYGSHLAACPWCARAARLGGRDPFPSREAVRSGKHLPPTPRRIVPPRPRPTPATAPAYPASPPAGATAYAPPAPLPLFALPGNNWTWAALMAVAVAFLPGLHLLAGLTATICGVVGWRRAVRAAPGERWTALAALGMGGLALAVSLTAGLLRPQNAAGTLTLHAHDAPVLAVAFAPNGRTVAEGSSRAEDEATLGGELDLWDARTGDQTRALNGFSGDVVSVAFSPDGKRIAVGTQAPLGTSEVRLWDIGVWALLPPLTENHFTVNAVAFSPDSKLIAGAGWKEAERRRIFGVVDLWDAQTETMTQTLTEPGAVFTIAFSPDGSRLAAGIGSSNGTGVLGRIDMWDLRTGRVLWTRTAHSTRVMSLAFSPDGTRLASSGNDNAARLWNAASGQPEGRPLEGEGAWIASVAFSPDGRLLASGGSDQTMRLWDVQSGQLKHVFPKQGAAINALAFSPDGHTIACGSQDGILKLWRVN